MTVYSFLIFSHERLQEGSLRRWWSEIGSREFQWIKLSVVAETGVKIIAGNDTEWILSRIMGGVMRCRFRDDDDDQEEEKEQGRGGKRREEEQNDGTWKKWRRGWQKRKARKERKKNKENRPRADLSKRQFRNYERNARERPADWNEIVSRFSSLTLRSSV